MLTFVKKVYTILRIEGILCVFLGEVTYMAKKTFSVHIDDDVYTLLREVQGRQKEKISLRQLLQGYVRAGIQRDNELSNFDKALSVHFENSNDPVEFKDYLNSSFVGFLIRLLDMSQPTYQDLAMMDATIVFWKIQPREFFKTLLTYARYGLADLKENE